MKKKMITIALILMIVLTSLYIIGYKQAMKKEKKKPIDLNLLVPLIEKDDNYILTSKYYELKTNASGSKIRIVFKNDEHQGTLKGTLKDDVLSFAIKNNDGNALTKAMLIYTVVDALGQLNGNDKGYVSSMFSNYDLKKATMDKDSFELSVKDDSNVYEFKTNQKFKLGKLKNNYYSLKDLEEYKDTLINEGFFQTTKGNLILYKDNDNQKKNVIYICELNELTSRTYNSLLNVIETMYGSEYKTSFQENYKELSSAQVLDRFDIIYDYQATDDDVVKKITTDNYKILKITINN